MPRDPSIKKALVIGSGPIVIGQAAEFDFSGSQACRAAREEGIYVVLLNSNPATIQTDKEVADAIYIEPMTVETVERIIEQEGIDGIFSGMGGQTALNLCSELADKGILKKYGVRLLGSNQSAISLAEDRELFREKMKSIGLPVAESITCNSIDGALRAVEKLGGYPVMIRSAYTLGGTGGGIAENEQELVEIVGLGLASSRIKQVIVEECIVNWEEYEYEIIRDGSGNSIMVCSMENLDPMGIHTGESIVIAPVQTLTDQEHQLLRRSAMRIVEALGIEGACNVQFAVNPVTREFRVVEVNPRVSRSSALASKATGYPIARVSAKIAVGLRLDEIMNSITKRTTAAFEPSLDYVVIKIPRWPFDKFRFADRRIGTQMKSTGETMAIGRCFEEAFLKALRSLELDMIDLETGEVSSWSNEQILAEIQKPTDRRIYAIIEAFRRSISLEEIRQRCHWNPFFLRKIERLLLLERRISDGDEDALIEATSLGFSPSYLHKISGREAACRRFYRMVDTCAAEFEAETPYYYSSATGTDEVRRSDRKSIMIVGGGPIRIGQGIEFDYCCVHAALAVKEEGYDAVIVNNNPETVSTDFDLSSRLYFEPLTRDDISFVLERERPDGIMAQFGGQTALNASMSLESHPLAHFLGTPVSSLRLSGERKAFSDFLKTLGLEQPQSEEARNEQQALEIARALSYPLIIRPSHIIGGRGMEIVYDEEQLLNYFRDVRMGKGSLLLERYLTSAVEVDVDVITDGNDVFIGGMLEHIEEAGVHSGDATMVTPPQSLSKEEIEEMERQVRILCRELRIRGLANFQFAVRDGKVYIIEVNPRGSRTVPFLSKVTGIPLAKIAAKLMLGGRLSEFNLHTVRRDMIAMKVSVFPFLKLKGVDSVLGPEMKSTGEVMGMGRSYGEAAWKGYIAAGYRLPTEGAVYITVSDMDKPAVLPVAAELRKLGFSIYATRGTQEFLKKNGIEAMRAYKLSEDMSPDAIGLMRSGKVHFIINTPTVSSGSHRDGALMRRVAVECGIPLATTIRGARAMTEAIAFGIKGKFSINRL
jgi:carbamoyl-phosphate synthase large subunit